MAFVVSGQPELPLLAGVGMTPELFVPITVGALSTFSVSAVAIVRAVLRYRMVRHVVDRPSPKRRRSTRQT